MDARIDRISRGEIHPQLIKEAKKEGCLFPASEKDNLIWFGVYKDGCYDLIGFGAIKINEIKNGKKTALLKCAFVSKEYRRRGYYKKLLTHRIKYCKDMGCSKVCGNFLKNAALAACSIDIKPSKQIQSKNSNITRLVYEL